MTETKKIFKFLNKIFVKPESNDLKLHYKVSKEREVDEADNKLEKDTINPHSASLKRHKTCSFDLSDKTLRLRNTHELTSIDASTTVQRRQSFELDRHFSDKPLPISDFIEREVLGEGAFGRAIKVEHIKSGNFFVLKEVISHSKENEDTLIREISILRSLKHDNVLTTVGLVYKNNSICLLTELMEGGSLQAKITNFDEEINLQQKLLFLRDIAAGMNFLHENCIMHRDLTSSNCLIRKNNTVVVSDFGLSKLLYGDSGTFQSARLGLSQNGRYNSTEMINIAHRSRNSSNLEIPINPKMRNYLSVGDIRDLDKKEENPSDDLRIGRHSSEIRRNMNIRRKHTVVGNPFWMAPEMLAGKDYNCHVDLYSFGIIGCEVTARVSAHPDFLERRQKDMSVNFPAFFQKHKNLELKDCPEDLIELVESCCQSDPTDRPSFNSILSWLESIIFRVSNNIQPKIRLSRVIDSD